MDPSTAPWTLRRTFAGRSAFSPRLLAALMAPLFDAMRAREHGGAIASPSDPNAWCYRERHGLT
jgi:hypothetical protein